MMVVNMNIALDLYRDVFFFFYIFSNYLFLLGISSGGRKK